MSLGSSSLNNEDMGVGADAIYTHARINRSSRWNFKHCIGWDSGHTFGSFGRF